MQIHVNGYYLLPLFLSCMTIKVELLLLYFSAIFAWYYALRNEQWCL